MALHETPSPDLSARNQLPLIEVAGYSVRCIASNIRTKDRTDWKSMQPISGIGYEGNLLLARVESVDARKEMEYLEGDEITDIPLLIGDTIIGVLANRHSGTSEYGDIPSNGIQITYGADIDLLAAGGIVGICSGIPKHLGTEPTKLKAIGLLILQEGKATDVRDFFPQWETEIRSSSPVVLILGTAAEIGKTTTARQLITDFKRQGIERVAATKLAGTGRKRDILSMQQSGAFPALDFPDVGLPTTYTSTERYIPATYTLLNRLNDVGNPEIIVAECGGDIIEGNIPTLLQDQDIMKYVTAIIHSSTDVLSVLGSLSLYKKWGILERIPIYLTYPIKRNYFAIKTRLNDLGIHLPIFDPLDNNECSHVVNEILSKI